MSWIGSERITPTGAALLVISLGALLRGNPTHSIEAYIVASILVVGLALVLFGKEKYRHLGFLFGAAYFVISSITTVQLGSTIGHGIMNLGVAILCMTKWSQWSPKGLLGGGKYV